MRPLRRLAAENPGVALLIDPVNAHPMAARRLPAINHYHCDA